MPSIGKKIKNVPRCTRSFEHDFPPFHSYELTYCALSEAEYINDLCGVTSVHSKKKKENNIFRDRAATSTVSRCRVPVDFQMDAASSNTHTQKEVASTFKKVRIKEEEKKVRRHAERRVHIAFRTLLYSVGEREKIKKDRGRLPPDCIVAAEELGWMTRYLGRCR